MSEVLTKAQRDALFLKVRTDPKFRELVKKNWKAAMRAIGIYPLVVADKTITLKDEGLAGQKGDGAYWTIVILDKGKPRANLILGDSLGFEKR